MSLSLQKRTENFTLSLQKKSINQIVACVATAYDISGSMNDEYRSGLMTEFNSRLMPVGLRFDDNGEIDNWVFNNRSKKVGVITSENFEEYVTRNITPIVGGGTSFAPVLEDIYTHYFGKKGGFLSKGTAGAAGDKPVYLLLQTDGDNDDPSEAESVLAKIEQAGMYVQFIGIGTDTTFRFIKKMGEKFNNVGFIHIPNLKQTTDEQLYDMLVNDEFKTFMQQRFPQYIK